MRRLLLLLIPVGLVLAWFLLGRSSPPETLFTKAIQERVVSAVTTNGKVEPIEYAAIRAETTGAVKRLHVESGQAVSKGQIMVTLDSAGAQAELSRAEAQISGARAELATVSQGGRAVERAEIESGLARAQADLSNSRRELETLQRLAGRNAATQAEVTAAREAVQKVELQSRSLERRREALITQPDRAAAEARVREAQTAAQAASQRIALTQIRSPLSGTLYRFDVKAGAFVNPGDLIGEVGKLDQLRVIVYVDEPELGRVQKGMPVTISWDALPGRQWKGVVDSVPTQVVALGTRQVGEVICRIDNPDLSLLPGTNVNVEIRSRVVENAITVPKEVLRREGSQTGVFKLQGDKLLWQPVKTGVASVTRVQVLEGVAEGDSVALPVDRPMKSGDVVRPVYQ